jgi:TonB family protein
MSNAACLVVSYVLNAAWQIPLFAAAGWVAARILQRWGPEAQHRVWVVTLMLSVLTPVFPICRAIFHAVLFDKRNGTAGTSFLALYAGDAGNLSHAGVLLLSPWLIGALFVVYTSSLLYFAVRLFWLLCAARALVRDACAAAWTSDAEALWRRARQAFVSTDAAVMFSTRIQGVMTVGARKPSIVLPAGFLSESEDEDLLSAFGHELAHVERRDYAKNLFYEIAGIAVAFHPVVWLIKKQIVETREMICDALVVERLVDSKPYRQSLLRLAQRMISTQTATAPAVGIFDGNILEKRIVSLKTKRTVLGKLSRAALAGCATLLLATTMAGVAALARPVDNTPQTYQDAPGTIYKIGGDVTAPVVIHSAEARFSEKARRAKYQGVCLISLVVDAQGNPQNVHVARALGMGLDKNAVEAVRQYKFKPALKNGRTPVPVAITIEVDFRLY